MRRPTRLYLEGLEAREVPATFTVINNSPDAAVPGSLAFAVKQANTTPGLDFINFNLPSGQQTINLSGPLSLTDQVVIDGTSQPGFAGTPLVVINGSTSADNLFRLVANTTTGTTSSGSTIQGLDFGAFRLSAIYIGPSSTGNFIQRNYIGFSPASGGGVQLQSQTTGFGAAEGVIIQSSFNTIRGNTISGVYDGVEIGEGVGGTPSGTVYLTNSISQNFIGTDPTGVTITGYGNLGDGILLGGGAQQNFLGPDNVLSGHSNSGVRMIGASVTGNVVFRDVIGLNASKTAALAPTAGGTFLNGATRNGFGVLLAEGANGNAVGGPFGGNFIAGNSLGGVVIGTPFAGLGAANGNFVQNNVIGLNGDQSAGVGTEAIGVQIAAGSTRNVVQANVLANQTLHGVLISNSQTNNISGNWIGQSAFGINFRNAAFGVALLPARRSTS